MPDAVLRYDPERLPELRRAFAEALASLTPKLEELGARGHLVETWMEDPVSTQVRAVYNDKVMSAQDGGYQSLRAYEQQLQQVHDTLLAAEEAYRRTEESNAGLMQ